MIRNVIRYLFFLNLIYTAPAFSFFNHVDYDLSTGYYSENRRYGQENKSLENTYGYQSCAVYPLVHNFDSVHSLFIGFSFSHSFWDGYDSNQYGEKYNFNGDSYSGCIAGKLRSDIFEWVVKAGKGLHVNEGDMFTNSYYIKKYQHTDTNILETSIEINHLISGRYINKIRLAYNYEKSEKARVSAESSDNTLTKFKQPEKINSSGESLYVDWVTFGDDLKDVCFFTEIARYRSNAHDELTLKYGLTFFNDGVLLGSGIMLKTDSDIKKFTLYYMQINVSDILRNLFIGSRRIPI